MIIREAQTRRVVELQVNFYRTVATSFLLLTAILLGVVVFFTSKKAEITVIAKEDERPLSFVFNVGSSENDKISIPGKVATVASRGEETYFPTSSKTKEGAAKGEVIIYNKSNISQPLVKTTRLLTPQGVLFRLSAGVTVPANGQITASVYADQPGGGGDILPSQFTIPGLSEAKRKLIYAESLAPMSGGLLKVGVLTEGDIKAAEADYKEKIKQNFKANSADSDTYNQRIISVNSSNIVSNHRAGDEVSEFMLSGDNQVTIVFYNQNDLMDLIEKEASKKIDLTAEKILSVKNTPTLSILSADTKNGVAEISVNENAVVTLDANAEKLSAQNFAGKTKDEIERYVLGLSHVSAVEIKFSPSWMRTAPSVVDKIKVVVKNVQ